MNQKTIHDDYEAIEKLVIRFSGDSGDGMQVTGQQFSSTSAMMGNDIATFPDFPAEIRAPQGTVAGISGFQVHFGATEISTPGDAPNVLVAMNPAALKANLSDMEMGTILILNIDAFTEMNLKKANLLQNPIDNTLRSQYQVIEAPITSSTREVLKDLELDTKSKERCKNFYALGMTYFMFARDLETTKDWIKKKFKKNPVLIEANTKALLAGYHFADTIETTGIKFQIKKATIESGTYRQINGNQALAYGFIAAAQRAGLDLFLGSYPITPASDVLHELSQHKDLGVKTFQAEDEISAIGSAIGASFTGALSITTSSGPGIALKSEALNLAVMMELPLVVIDIQRGGPSTGLPTKTEQSDLNMALGGRNGESPLVILAAKSPSDCFHKAYMASKISLEHMTPVMLLSDGYLANGSEPWKIDGVLENLEEIKHKKITHLKDGETFYPYKRDEHNLSRPWAIPGSEKLMHRLGGLEKDQLTGDVSYDPSNHEEMVLLREQKVLQVSHDLPEEELYGVPLEDSDLLFVSWGGTFGHLQDTLKELRQKNLKVSHLHINYLYPFAKNVEDLLTKAKKIVVCELNRGQLFKHLNAHFKIAHKSHSYSKVRGKPFTTRELVSLGEFYLSNGGQHDQ